MSSAVISHLQTGLDRVATQYENKPKFLAYLTAILKIFDELEGVFQKIAEQTDLDLVDGVSIDVLGEIVGVSRILPNAIPMEFFGFDDQVSTDCFGEENVIGVGARLWDELEAYGQTSVLSDPEYLMLIRAKIVRNHSQGTNEDMLNGLAFLFPNVRVLVDDGAASMSIDIAIGRNLTFQEKYFLKVLGILPKAGGVKISSFVSFDQTQYFGFDGQVGALSFCEEGQPGGGLLAEEF